MKPRTLTFAYLISTAVLISVFLATYCLWRQADQDPIVFYQGLKIVAICAGVYAVGFVIAVRTMKRYAALLSSIAVPSIATFILLGYSFVITIPSLLDRSISIYILSIVSNAPPSGIDAETINDLFLRGYIDGTVTVKKRLHEQIVSGHIVEDGKLFRITPKGARVNQTNIWLGKILNIPDKNIIAINGRNAH